MFGELSQLGLTVLVQYFSARAALGQKFGTKKSKDAIKRREANQINVNEMDTSVTTSIVSQVRENVKSMPTKQDLENEHIEKRLLPPYRTEEITSPAQIYNLEDVVSKDELDLVFVRDWYRVAEAGKRIDVLYVFLPSTPPPLSTHLRLGTGIILMSLSELPSSTLPGVHHMQTPRSLKS